MSALSSIRQSHLTASEAESIVRQGEASLGRRDYQAARDAADTVLAELPFFASALHLRGAACKALHAFAEAAEAYRALLLEFPDFHHMRMNLAHCLMELGQLDEAETCLCDAIARKNDFALAYASLGSLYIRKDRYDLAEAPTRHALALDGTILSAHQNLAAILDVRDDPYAKQHRDAAYREQQLFVEASPGATRTTLIITASGRGNIPYTHILPRSGFNRILWHIAYAPMCQTLPPHDIAFNAVGDPDAAAEAQTAAEDFTASYQGPLINHPRAVARTHRSGMPDLLGTVPGLLVPGTKRFCRADGDMASAIASSGLQFPLIIRAAGRHGGEGTKLVRSASELAGLTQYENYYATEFANYRSGDGWYRKYRVIFVDGVPFPYHLAIGSKWLLHYKSAEMDLSETKRAEERAFLADPAGVLGQGAMLALRNVAARLDLDYAGMDFSRLEDGRLLFFEANATMLVHPEEDARFAYRNPAVDEIVAAVDAMIGRRIDAFTICHSGRRQD